MQENTRKISVNINFGKDHTNKRATKSNNPAAEAEQDIHRLSESETEEDEESSDQHNTIETVINVDNVPEDAEVAGENPTFSPRSQMNRRAKKAAKKNIDQTDTVDAAETTEPIPPSTKKALKVPAPKTNKKSGNPLGLDFKLEASWLRLSHPAGAQCLTTRL